MVLRRTESRAVAQREIAKKAIALALNSQWAEAVSANQSILEEHPDDVEACNRLGKALAELGRNKEAIAAFHRAQKISPGNTIAKKNLERLALLEDESPKRTPRAASAPKVFIEESGKTVVTSLNDVAERPVLLTLAPGHQVVLKIEEDDVTACDQEDTYLGRLEPRLNTRLLRLAKGGNRYEAGVKQVGEGMLTIIVKETYRDPAQMGVVSFPPFAPTASADSIDPGAVSTEPYAIDEEREEAEVKDWSSDDTEPGDDEAFTPAVHRIVNPADNDDDENI